MPQAAMILTDDQRKIVEENHNLIYYHLRKQGLDIDAYYGVAAVGICKAAADFDPSLGFKFATYATACMQNEIRMQFRRDKRWGNNISLETITCDGDSAALTLEGLLGCEEDFTARLIHEDIASFVKTLNQIDRILFKGLLEKTSQYVLSEKLGCSQPNVSRRQLQIKKKLAAFLGEESLLPAPRKGRKNNASS